MPKAPRARQPNVADRIRLFADHHIVAIRTARKNGEIIAVKHAAWGWMSPKAYYAMQEAHAAAVAILPKLMEGAYRFKAALISASVEIAGFGIPVGGPLYAYFLLRGALNINGDAPGQKTLGLLELYATLGPFGELLFPLVAASQGELDLGQAISYGAPTGGAAGNSPNCEGLLLTFNTQVQNNLITQARGTWDTANNQGCPWTSSLSRP